MVRPPTDQPRWVDVAWPGRDARLAAASGRAARTSRRRPSGQRFLLHGHPAAVSFLAGCAAFLLCAPSATAQPLSLPNGATTQVILALPRPSSALREPYDRSARDGMLFTEAGAS
jgi:hypothetical protein